MGKLTIEGRASKKYDYDQMSVSVTFHSRMSTTSQALKNVMRQSELFLEKLDAAGIAPENVQIGKDSTEEESYHEPYTVRANRELKISTAFSMDFANYIRYLIEENELDAEIETNYAFSNQEAIRAELIRLALEDSKAKAGDIAQTMGQKLVGIESVVVGNDPPAARPADAPFLSKIYYKILTKLYPVCYPFVRLMLRNSLKRRISQMKESNAPAIGRTPFQKWLDKYQGLFYLIPWIIGFVVFKAVPFGQSLYYSFTDMNFFKSGTQFVGLANYITAFTTTKITKALIITFKYAFITVPLKPSSFSAPEPSRIVRLST